MMAIPALRTEASLVIIMGTSLKVHPFAMLPNLVPSTGCVRLLLNLEPAGNIGAFSPRAPATLNSDHETTLPTGAKDDDSKTAEPSSRAQVGGGEKPLHGAQVRSGLLSRTSFLIYLDEYSRVAIPTKNILNLGQLSIWQKVQTVLQVLIQTSRAKMKITRREPHHLLHRARGTLKSMKTRRIRMTL